MTIDQTVHANNRCTGRGAGTATLPAEKTRCTPGSMWQQSADVDATVKQLQGTLEEIMDDNRENLEKVLSA